MIVDDEEMISHLACRLLEKGGYNAIAVASGIEAIRLYGTEMSTISAVLLDLTMPAMSGSEVFGHLRNINPQVKIIISSGHSEESIREGVLASANGYIIKPYTFNQLMEGIRLALQGE